MKSSEAMSEEKEGKEEEFTTVMSKSEKRKAAKTLREKSPTPTPAVPDSIGGTSKTKKATSKKSKKGNKQPPEQQQ